MLEQKCSYTADEVSIGKFNLHKNLAIYIQVKVIAYFLATSFL